MKKIESVYKEKKECCGCTACEKICPKNAITMSADEEGFLYPLINHEKCINCYLCTKICSFSKKGTNDTKNSVLDVYAAKHKSENVRMNSSSGGVFTAISDYVLENKGVVFGATLDKNIEVSHMKVTSKDERDRLRGSKYVQSNLKDTFNEVKQLLKQNIPILFTGTPCQVDGLKGYLRNEDTSNLILCDIVCHGVPSPLIFNEYIKYIENITKKNVIDYKCRDKSNGWHTHTEKVVFSDGNEDNSSKVLSVYKNLFYSHNMLRPACHNCKYTNLNRGSDITISDYWGIEKSMPEFDDNKGITLILVNSDKGEKCFAEIEKMIEYRKSNTDDCIQPQLIRPSEISIERENFWRDYKKYGFEYISKKYGRSDIISKIKRKVRTTIIGIKRRDNK